MINNKRANLNGNKSVNQPKLKYLAAVIGGSVLMHRASRPVEAMRASAEQIGFNKLSQRLFESATGDALENPANAFNQRVYRACKARIASRGTWVADHSLHLSDAGGTIEATCVESVGTTLTVKLPFAARPNF